MPPEDKSNEPSMEEILASIRRIISEESEGQGDKAPADEGVLELTQVVDEPPRAPDPAPATASAEPDVVAPAPAPTPDERLVSDLAASLAGSKFTALARAAEPDPLAGIRGGQTVEQIVIDLLRPMLKDWLDANLPTIVERLVEREIRYLSRRNESE
jgi:hypothetical protein